MCAYKPPRISNTTKRGTAQILIKKSDPSKVKVRLNVPVDGKKGEYTIEEYYLSKEDCPAYIKSGTWRVTLSANGEKMWDAYPSDGDFVVQFKEIAHKENEIPTPTPRTDAFKNEYMDFVMKVEVSEGEFEGVVFPLFLRYNFGPEKDPETGKTVVGYTHYDPKKPSKFSIFLDKIMTALGMWEKGPMLWNDNLLPVIAKRLRAQAEAGRKARLFMADGYPTNAKPIEEVDEDWDGDEEEVDEEKKPEPAKVAAGSAPVTEPDPDEEETTEVAEETKDASDDDMWAD